jgi:predicted Zn-dependent peptidase
VGDFDSNQARELIEKYFGGIPAQTLPPPVDVSEPPGVATTTETYHDPLAPAPAFVLGWKIPARRTPEFYALSLAGTLLFDGDSSRLYQKLVKGDESVVSIEGGVDERRGPSALYIFALPKPGEDVAAIREKIFAEINSIAASGPTAEEMEKLRNSICNDAVRGRQSTMYRAQRIAEYALYDSNPGLFDAELESYLNVTAEGIRDAVARFIDVDNRVVLDIVPAQTSAGEAEMAVASPQSPGEPQQPTAPAPQIPEKPNPESPGTAADVSPMKPTSNPVPSNDPADANTQLEQGSGPLHL